MATDSNRPAYAKARVLVTLDLPIPQGWSGSCTVDEVHKHAQRAAVDILNRELGGMPKDQQPTIREVHVQCTVMEPR